MCNNGLFSESIIQLMHEQMVRLYLATTEKLGISDPSEVARALGVTHQTVTNWQTRGISKNGALLVQAKLGISATWIEYGTGKMYQSDEDDEQVDADDLKQRLEQQIEAISPLEIAELLSLYGKANAEGREIIMASLKVAVASYPVPTPNNKRKSR